MMHRISVKISPWRSNRFTKNELILSYQMIVVTQLSLTNALFILKSYRKVLNYRYFQAISWGVKNSKISLKLSFY